MTTTNEYELMAYDPTGVSIFEADQEVVDMLDSYGWQLNKPTIDRLFKFASLFADPESPIKNMRDLKQRIQYAVKISKIGEVASKALLEECLAMNGRASVMVTMYLRIVCNIDYQNWIFLLMSYDNMTTKVITDFDPDTFVKYQKAIEIVMVQLKATEEKLFIDVRARKAALMNSLTERNTNFAEKYALTRGDNQQLEKQKQKEDPDNFFET
jgi:hypothetical protein